jgi:hypothetical protein
MKERVVQNRLSNILRGGFIVLGLLILWRFAVVYRSLQEGMKNASPETQKPERLFSRIPNQCLPICNQPPVRVSKVAISTKKTSVRVAVKKVVPDTVRLASLPKHPKNPNSIRISIVDAPEFASPVKLVGGRGTCIKKKDKGRKSTQNSKGHIDRECCLDPDEIPNPRCLYK